MNDLQNILPEYLPIIFLAAFFSVINGLLAYKKGFFRYPKKKAPSFYNIPLIYLLGAFLVFITLQIFLVPLVFILYFVIQSGEVVGLSDRIQQDPTLVGWFNVFVMSTSTLGVLFYSWLLGPQLTKMIWNKEGGIGEKRIIKNFFFGIATWLVCYPIVIALSQMIALLLHWFFEKPEVDQVAVKAIKMTLDDPYLFGSTFICMILLVPVLEEMLFRGFLQTWLGGLFSRKTSIVLTSIVFALFHFSYSQGLRNVEFIAALFVLSCFLGYIYERQGSLWAPIGLHVFFNTISVLTIVFS